MMSGPCSSECHSSTHFAVLGAWVLENPSQPNSRKVFVPKGKNIKDKPHNMRFRYAGEKTPWTRDEWGWTPEGEARAQMQMKRASLAKKEYHHPGSEWHSSEYGYKKRYRRTKNTRKRKRPYKGLQGDHRVPRNDPSNNTYRNVWNSVLTFRRNAAELLFRMEAWNPLTMKTYSLICEFMRVLMNDRRQRVPGQTWTENERNRIVDMSVEVPEMSDMSRIKICSEIVLNIEQDVKACKYQPANDFGKIPFLKNDGEVLLVYRSVLMAYLRALKSMIFRITVHRVEPNMSRDKDARLFVIYYDAANVNLAYCLNRARARVVPFDRPDKAGLDRIGEESCRDIVAQMFARGKTIPLYLSKYAPEGALIQSERDLNFYNLSPVPRDLRGVVEQQERLSQSAYTPPESPVNFERDASPENVEYWTE